MDKIVKIPPNRAIELFEARLKDLALPSVDLQSLKSRIQMDAEQVFGRGSTQVISVIGLPWSQGSMYGHDAAKDTYRQTLRSFIGFIKDFHLISQEEMVESEAEYRRKYEELVAKWNALVPEYNKSLTESQKLRSAYDDALLEINMLKQKLSEKPGPAEVRKILFLGAGPTDEVRLRSDKELRDIETGLELTSLRDSFELKQRWAVTVDSLQRAMLSEEPQIVHFSGHGNRAGIAVEDSLGNARLISNEAIASLFEAFKERVQCVIMSSCYSESQAREIAKHVPYVVGMKESVPDDTAIAFSVGFYTALGAGRNIAFAFKMGIVRIKLEGISGSDVPILIG